MLEKFEQAESVSVMPSLERKVSDLSMPAAKALYDFGLHLLQHPVDNCAPKNGRGWHADKF